MSSNLELIQTMCPEDFNKFLFRFKTKNLANFFTGGGAACMDAVQQKEWLESDNKELLFELMRDKQ